MNPVEILAQRTSHTLTSRGITTAVEHEIVENNGVYAWNKGNGLVVEVWDDPYILAMDFEPDDFLHLPRGFIYDAKSEKWVPVRSENLSAMARYVLTLLHDS
jgi:hypothetical protein